MTSQQQIRLAGLTEAVRQLHSDVGSLKDMYASFVARPTECVLSANSEGLLYFACILLHLAKEQSNGQHFHFDEHTVLDETNSKLVLMYVEAPWGHSSNAISSAMS